LIKNDIFDCNTCISDKYSRKEVPGGSGKKTPEIDGPCNQYSGRKFSEIFPMILGRFPPRRTGGRQESTGKIRTISGRNKTSMFQRFPVFSCRTRWLSCRMPRDPVAGIVDLGMLLFIVVIIVSSLCKLLKKSFNKEIKNVTQIIRLPILHRNN